MIKLSYQSELQDLHGTSQEEVLPPFPVEFEPKTTWAGAPAASMGLRAYTQLSAPGESGLASGC